jgi:hypothetical protein
MGGTSCKLIWKMSQKSEATTCGATAGWVGGSGCGGGGWGGCKLILAMAVTSETKTGGSPAGSQLQWSVVGVTVVAVVVAEEAIHSVVLPIVVK